jgi:hypothetical protein
MTINEILVQEKTSFNDLVTKAQGIQSKCADYNITNAGDHNIRHDADSLKFIYRADTNEIRNVGATPHALSQMCNKIGVPTRYIDKCIQSGRVDLASDNINSWLDGFNKNLFIREHDGKIRGVLSDRYSVLDTPDILDSVLGNAILHDDEYKVQGHFITPERFHTRLIQREPMNIAGEDLFAGIQIDSSDVGRSILTAKLFIYKQVCTNGLVVSKAGGMMFQQKHVGITKEEFYEGFNKSMDNIYTLIENAETFIGTAIKDNSYRNVFHSQKDMETLVNSLKIKTKLSDDGVTKVIDTMKSTYEPTRWGLINAITQVAQDYTLERRLELESIAGELLLVA